MKFKKLTGCTLAAALAVSAVAGGALSVVAEGKQADTVTPYAAVADDEDYGYLYVHFVDEQETAAKEQVYFSISPNAKEWYILNDRNPVAWSDLGDKGIRDPYILRKHDGSGYYIIATDLSIFHLGEQYGGDCWGVSQQNGSHSIIVWETDDLTDLGEARIVEIAPKNATCTWAPEAIWDEDMGAYMVFWSALANKSWNNNGTWETGMAWTHHVYKSYTNDFVNFTEPEIYIESEQKTIDSTIIKEGDYYYRFTKIETNTGDDIYNSNYGSKTIFMEKCESLSGEWQMVSTYEIDGKHWSKTTGYEGPSIFKLNERDTDGSDQWCLMLDDYGGDGYTPFMTDDLATGKFTRATDVTFDGGMLRHGSFLPLKKSEFDALCKKYNLNAEDFVESEREHKTIFSMSFEENMDVNEGSAAIQTFGDFTYEEGAKAGSKALRLDGTDYIKIDGSVFNGLDGMTISFAAKFNHPTGNASGRSWLFFASQSDDPIIWSANGTHEKYAGLIWGENGGQALAAQRFWDGRTPSPETTVSASTSEWHHITIVYGKRYTGIYIDGEQVARTGTTVDLTTILGSNPYVYIGKSNWGSGEYSNCLLDEYRIHNWGMTAGEVMDNYRTVMGITD